MLLSPKIKSYFLTVPKLLVSFSARVCDPVVSSVPSLKGLVIYGQESLFLQPFQNRVKGGILDAGDVLDLLA